MKVSELIERLQKCNPEAVIKITDSNPELNHQSVECTYIRESFAKREKVRCVDMMDHEPYSTEILSYAHEGDENAIPVVVFG